jgi:membrane-bound serine protease (ClpP class)
MWNEFVSLFTEMGAVPAVLLTIGIIFGIIETFTPGLHITGGIAVICVLAGIIVRMVEGGSITQLLIMFLLFILFFVLVILIMIRSAKFGFIAKSAIVENGVAISKDYDNKKDLEKLIGKKALTLTELRPVGKIDINGNTYEAISESGYIVQGLMVIVSRINDNGQIVVKANEEN